MEKKQKMLELRKRLDETLGSHDLTNEESIKSLVKEQLLRSPFHGTEGDMKNIVGKRAIEVSNFLEMLRSASGDEQKAPNAHGSSHNKWKVKQDSDQIRVMYREGPHGTPFHTLLVEGYIDGPIDVCLCVSWESTLYKKWWPQYNIPTFKIIMSSCLQKVRIGEEISLVRVKVPWPVSDREALLHYLEIEYFKEDLILVLLNTISDTEHIDVRTHGFTRDGIPEAKDIVRVDLVGGFVLQKVSSNQSYFRTIANLDIKLDFVPPSLINFISRQLIGNGYKLYQKAVSSVGTNDEDHCQALEEQIYVRIREGLECYNKPKTVSVGMDEIKPSCFVEEQTVETLEENFPAAENNTSVTEIVEEVPEQSLCLECNQHRNGFLTNSIAEQNNLVEGGAFISLEVESALGVLDRAIALVREHGLADSNQSTCSSIDQEGACISNGLVAKVSKIEMPSDGAHGRSATADCSQKSEAYHLQNQEESVRISTQDDAYNKATVIMTQPPPPDGMSKVCDDLSLKTNGIYGSGMLKEKRKKSRWICCISLSLI